MYARIRALLLSFAIIILLASVEYTDSRKTSIDHTLSRASAANFENLAGDEGDEGDEFEFDEFGRPILSGEELLLDTEHFLIHYTLSGRDAAHSTAFIDEIALALEYSWQMEINEFGWQAPPADNGIGGDDRYDIYIQALSLLDELGYVDTAPLACSTDPFKRHGTSSFMVLDSTFTGYESEGFEKLLEMVRSTIAHELNHSIQYGYDSVEPAYWLLEATATWMEDEVYDDFNTADEYNTAVFKSPDTCQLAEGGVERGEDEFHWYGEYLYLRYISEQHGHETIRSIWEHTLEFDSYDAIDAALSKKNTSLEETVRGFSLALLTRDFEEGERYPTVRLEGQANVETTFTPDDGVGQMAADYVEILSRDAGVVFIELNADNLQGTLVGVRDQEATIIDMPTNQLTVDMSSFDNLYLVVLNPTQAFREYRCEKTPYTVDVMSSAQPTADQSVQTLPVPNFQTPKVEPLEDPEDYFGEEWDEIANKFKAPAEWIPHYLPPGYEFTDAWEITAEEYEKEFEVEAIWYIPGDGLATQIDFWGPCDDFFFNITISESPYETLDGWYIDTDYTPYDDEILTINGIEIVFVDWTDDIGPFFDFSFIYAGKFVVIEGTLTMDEMTKVVESLFE